MPYYINNGSSVFCTLLGATKAFHRVEYVTLFRLLMVRDPPVSLRLLLNMYTCHGTRIAWNGVCSEYFSVLNGGIFSPVLFCIYLDDLFSCILAESKIGCFIGNVFVDVLAYADDIALLAPTTRAVRMLGICEDFAQEYAIVFNAKKSKCHLVKHSSALKVASERKYRFVIGGSVFELVDSWPHLDLIIASSNDDNLDILNRLNSLWTIQ